MTTLDEKAARRLEPFAPSPLRKIKALETLSRAGIPSIIRLDPLIPGLNDDEKTTGSVLERASEEGVTRVIASTYKMKPDSLLRIIAVFPELEKRLNDLYGSGERFGRSMYMLEERRRMLASNVRNIAISLSMGFSSYREELQDLNTTETCDGSHSLVHRNCFKNIV